MKEMQMNVKRTVVAVLLLALSGCGGVSDIRVNPLEWWSGPSEQVSQQLAGATRYECAGNKRLAVRYGTPANAALVILPDREFRLDAAPGASAGAGARYTNGRTTLETKGDEVFLEEGGASIFANCKRVS